MYGGFSVIDDLDGHFRNLIAVFYRPEDRFEVERKAVDLTARKDRIRRISAEGLTAAL